MRLGGWELVGLEDMISHINFSFLLRSTETEKIFQYCVVG